LLLKCDIRHNLFFDDGKNYVQKASSRAKAVDESVYEGYVERKLRLGEWEYAQHCGYGRNPHSYKAYMAWYYKP